jgi:hypothetical protein
MSFGICQPFAVRRGLPRPIDFPNALAWASALDMRPVAGVANVDLLVTRDTNNAAGHQLTQATADNQPLLTINSRNRWGAWFGDVGALAKQLRGDSIPTAYDFQTNDWTISVALEWQTQVAQEVAWSLEGAGGELLELARDVAGNVHLIHWDPPTAKNIVTAVAATGLQVLTVRKRASGISLYVDGAIIIEDFPNPGLPATMLTLGCRRDLSFPLQAISTEPFALQARAMTDTEIRLQANGQRVRAGMGAATIAASVLTDENSDALEDDRGRDLLGLRYA